LVVSLLSVGNRKDGSLNRQDVKGAKRTRENFVLCALAVNSLLDRAANTLQGYHRFFHEEQTQL
jgi:hypothetical protein